MSVTGTMHDHLPTFTSKVSTAPEGGATRCPAAASTNCPLTPRQRCENMSQEKRVKDIRLLGAKLAQSPLPTAQPLRGRDTPVHRAPIHPASPAAARRGPRPPQEPRATVKRRLHGLGPHQLQEAWLVEGRHPNKPGQELGGTNKISPKATDALPYISKVNIILS